MPLTTLVQLEPFNINASASFTFANVTASENINGDGSGLSNISGANVTGQVANALVAGTVYTNAQPNITSVGTLSVLTVSGNVTANYFIGNGSQLTGLPAGYTDSDANSAIDAYVTKSFIDSLNVDADTLDGHDTSYFATSTQGGLADSAIQPGDNISTLTNDAGYLVTANISTVGISGNYEDLNNLPTLFDGEYSSLANTPTLGTAAATSSSDYATAAQGLKADTALQPADLTGYATETYVNTAVSNLVDAAPTTLDTLNELAAALGDDPNFATTIANSIGNKLAISDFTSTADTWLTTKSTSDVTEGTNQYYTVDRANTAIDNRVTKSFVESLSANANIANSVAVGNVTGIGNIATINLDGNSSTILYGNGVFSAAPVTYSNSNVATYLPTYTGNLSPGNLTISVANLFVSGGTSGYVLSTDGTGNLSWVEQSATGGGTSGGGESTVTSVDTFTGDGTTVEFTLSVTPQTISQTFVNYNGAMQLRSAYTLSGAVITFSEAPANGSEIEVTTQMNVTSGSGNLVVRNYTADGVQSTYSVSSGVNATNILVTENGLLQTPTVDYTVSGSTLTFVQAPGYGVKIQIRELGVAIATITPTGSNTQVLFNDSGEFGNSSGLTYNKTNSTLTVGNVAVSSYVVGNLIPSANVTYNLGSDTRRWKDLFLSGNTIDLAGAQIKSDPVTGSIAFVPPATVDTPNPTALVVSPTGSLTPAATVNGVLDANAFTTALSTGTVYSPRYISMVTTGALAESTGNVRYYPPSNIQIRGTTASLSTSSSATFTFVLKKNGISAGTYSISANQYQLTPTSANISVTTSDYLTVDITASSGASDLRIDLEYTVV